MLADITLTTEAASIVTAMVGTLWTAVVLLWRDDMRRRDADAAEMRRRYDALLEVILRHGLRSEVPWFVPPDESDRSD